MHSSSGPTASVSVDGFSPAKKSFDPVDPKLRRRSSKFSWSLLKSKIIDYQNSLTQIDLAGHDQKLRSPSKVDWRSPDRTGTSFSRKKESRNRISPPIPARPKEHLYQRRLLVAEPEPRPGPEVQIPSLPCEARTVSPKGQCRHHGSKPALLNLADLDPDKRGDAFERIHPDGWNKVLPRLWVEQDLSDDDSKDTEETRSVYSQDNGEEQSRQRRHELDFPSRSEPKRQQSVKPVDQIAVCHGPDEPERRGLFRDGSDVDQGPAARARSGCTSLITFTNGSSSPRAPPCPGQAVSNDRRETQRLRSFQHSGTALRDVLTRKEAQPSSNDTQDHYRCIHRHDFDELHLHSDSGPEDWNGRNTGSEYYDWHSQQSVPSLTTACTGDDHSQEQKRSRLDSWLEGDRALSPLDMVPPPLRFRRRKTKVGGGRALPKANPSILNRITELETGGVGPPASDPYWINRGLAAPTPVQGHEPKPEKVEDSCVGEQLEQKPPSVRSSWSSVLFTSESGNDCFHHDNAQSHRTGEGDGDGDNGRHQTHACHDHHAGGIVATGSAHFAFYPDACGEETQSLDFKAELGEDQLLDLEAEIGDGQSPSLEGNQAPNRDVARETRCPQGPEPEVKYGRCHDQTILASPIFSIADSGLHHDLGPEIDDILETYLRPDSPVLDDNKTQRTERGHKHDETWRAGWRYQQAHDGTSGPDWASKRIQHDASPDYLLHHHCSSGILQQHEQNHIILHHGPQRDSRMSMHSVASGHHDIPDPDPDPTSNDPNANPNSSPPRPRRCRCCRSTSLASEFRVQALKRDTSEFSFANGPPPPSGLPLRELTRRGTPPLPSRLLIHELTQQGTPPLPSWVTHDSTTSPSPPGAKPFSAHKDNATMIPNRVPGSSGGIWGRRSGSGIGLGSMTRPVMVPVTVLDRNGQNWI